MKKKITMTLLLSIVGIVLLSGCGAKVSQGNVPVGNVPAKESAPQDAPAGNLNYSAMQEELDSLKTDMFQYMNTPAINDYVLIPASDIQITDTPLDNTLILKLTNLSDISYGEINLLLSFYDSESQLINYTSVYIDCLLSGKTLCTTAYYPLDNNNQRIQYDHYEIQMKGLPMASDTADYSNEVSFESNIGNDGYVLAKFTNHSDKPLNLISAYILYYDEAGSLIGCENFSVYDVLAGAYDFMSFSSPRDSNYMAIPFADYKITISCAKYQEQKTPRYPVAEARNVDR